MSVLSQEVMLSDTRAGQCVTVGVREIVFIAGTK